MNKEELIRNLRYTEKKHRNDVVDTFDTDISMMCSDVLKVLKNCIEIPEGATNGDIIRAIFSDKVAVNIRYSFYRDWFNGDMARLDEHSQEFLLDWWNEPYKNR